MSKTKTAYTEEKPRLGKLQVIFFRTDSMLVNKIDDELDFIFYCDHHVTTAIDN